jgi:hypothetical protein
MKLIRANQSTRGGGGNLSQCHFVHQKSHMDWRGVEPSPPLWEAGDQPPEPWHGLNGFYLSQFSYCPIHVSVLSSVACVLYTSSSSSVLSVRFSGTLLPWMKIWDCESHRQLLGSLHGGSVCPITCANTMIQTQKRRIILFMTWVGFEHTIPLFKRQKPGYYLGCAVIVVGMYYIDLL